MARSEKADAILSRAVNIANCVPRLLKKASAATKRASGRSWAKLANAASISPTVVAFRTRSCTPVAAAASFVPCNAPSAVEAFAGLTSTATRAAFGTISCKRRNRLASTSLRKSLTPVALPPGRARLATRPSFTGSWPTAKTIGICRGCRFRGQSARVVSSCGNHSHLAADQIGHHLRQAIVVALHKMIFDRNVLPIDEADFAKAFVESRYIARIGIA
jgi:hypothetical protein